MTVETRTNHTNQLRQGTLSLGFIIFFVISAAGPLVAIAGGFPIGMMLGNGAGTPALLVFTVVVLLMFSAGYTAMARYITNAGGFYAFIDAGLGRVPGAAAALVALLGYNTMQIGLYGMFGAVSSSFLAAKFGVTVPWWGCSFAALTSIAILGYRQIDLSAKVLSILVIGEYLVVLILDVAILYAGGAHGIKLTSFTPHAIFSGAPSIGVLFCFAAFIGFEATTIYGEEAKDPKRTIPLATYLSVLLIGIFYTFSIWCMVIGAGADDVVKTLTALADPTTFLYSLSDHYANKALSLAMSILFITSIYAGLIAFHNSAARYFYATGRDGLLPKILGRTHPKHQSPHVGSVIQTALALLVVAVFVISGADPILALFSWFTNIATLCVIALMALTSFAVLAFFNGRAHATDGTLRTVILPVISGVLLICVLVLAIANFDVLTGASKTISYILTGLLPLAAIAGVLLARRPDKISLQIEIPRS